MISFIVPAHNEEALIGRTLTSILEAAQAIGERCEILVVDDASTDATAAVARENGAQVIRIEHRQIAAARNAGAAAARGRWFMFVDADTVVSPDVIRAAVEAMQRGAVGGGCLVRFDGRLPAYLTILEPMSHVVRRIIRIAGGCFLFCTRQAFETVGGFERDVYAAEEVFMSQALKRIGRFVVLRESVVTSGRKVRTYSARELFGTLFRIAIRGRAYLQDRRGLGLWYGQRREDPEDKSVGRAWPL